MKVLLLEDVKGLGKKGDVKEVKVGYGNNFLLKNKKAILANDEVISAYEQDERTAKARIDTQNKELVDLAHKLEKFNIKIAHKSGKDNSLFGAVTSAHISDAIKQEYNIFVDKKNIYIENTIKTIGVHTIICKLGNGINASVVINVVGE
jgi:large subunit ribosomal protein L9